MTETPPVVAVVPRWRTFVDRAGPWVGMVLVGLLAFTAGRFDAPLQVETNTVTETRWRERVVEKVVTIESSAKVERKVVYVDRVITKEGEVRERIVERTVTAEEAKKEVVAEKVATAEFEHHEEDQRKVTLRPDWRVSLQVGASLRDPLLPIAGPLVIQACGDRRIAGGFSASLCLNTVGTATAGVSLEF